MTFGVRILIKVVFVLGVGVAMYFMVHALLAPFIWIPTAAAIAWRGGWEARTVALSYSLSLLAAVVGWRLSLFPHLYQTSESRLGVLTLDALTCAVLLVVAVRSRLWWPSWAAAFNCLLVASHLIFMVWREAIEPWAYISSAVIFSWFLIVLQAIVALDLCVEPSRIVAPRPLEIVLLLVVLLAFLPLLPTLKQFDAPGRSGALHAYHGAQLAWLAVVLGAFVLSQRRASHA